MPNQSVPPDVQATAMAAAWAILWAAIGRLLYVMNLVRIGRRDRFWSVQTGWELGVAIGMGVVAGGMAEYLGLTGLTSAGFIAAVAYTGPHALEMAFAAAAKRVGVGPTPEPDCRKSPKE